MTYIHRITIVVKIPRHYLIHAWVDARLLITRQLQSAQDLDICCDPGTAGFVKDSHSQKSSFWALCKGCWGCKWPMGGTLEFWY